jgi:hypothetical protein
MGAIHFSIDPDLARLLRDSLDLSLFVETGTFKGDSVALVRSLFKELHTCELSPALHAAAAERFARDGGVHCHLGPAPEILLEIAAQNAGHPILYWLDAHWCSASDTAGEESQCPLLEELDAIHPLHSYSVVWIDDARYFMAPPPEPLVSAGWPSFQQVLDRLQRISPSGQHRLVFANDTILFHPVGISDQIDAYLRRHGADWLQITHLSKEATKRIGKKSRPPASRFKRLRKRIKGFFQGGKGCRPSDL